MVQYFQKSKRRSVSTVIAILLILSSLFVMIPTKASAASSMIQIPGSSGYMSLTQYINTTDIPNVYEVTFSISPTIKPTLTDIVILINEGHDDSRDAVINDPTFGTAPFGNKLASGTGVSTGIPRKSSPSGFTVYDAELYSAEQIIRKLADPLINKNYRNTRVAIISYGVGGSTFNAVNRSGLVSLADLTGLDFLLGKIGTIDSTVSYVRGPNPVPLAKALQQAYQMLEISTTPLFFQYSSVNPADYALPYPTGTIAGNPSNGTWTAPNGKTANDFDSINKFIVSLHSIGASGSLTQTMHPLTSSIDPHGTPTDFSAVFTPIGATSTQSETASAIPYNATRYVTKVVSENLIGQNQTQKVIQPFTFWIDPSKIVNSNASRWLDFNETISQFPSTTPALVPGSGFVFANPTRSAMHYDKLGPPLPNSGRSYENLEGIQYWSDVAEAHNVVDYPGLNTELADLVNKLSSYAKDAVVNSVFKNQFQVYDYPGRDSFTVGSSPDTSPSHDGGTVTYVNQQLTWDIGAVPETGTLMLKFYIYFDASQSDSDLSYLFSDTTFSYNFNGHSEWKNFPNAYVPGGDKSASSSDNSIINSDETNNIINPENISNSASPATNSDTYGMNIYGLPTAMPTYTPSVTPTPKATALSDEKVDDATIEMPATGETKPIWIIPAFVILSAVSIVIIQKKQSKNK